jgi:hypothetical protein
MQASVSKQVLVELTERGVPAVIAPQVLSNGFMVLTVAPSKPEQTTVREVAMQYGVGLRTIGGGFELR